jgi:hypothetical protein
MFEMNYLAIIVAAVAAFFAAGGYYAALGKQLEKFSSAPAVRPGCWPSRSPSISLSPPSSPDLPQASEPRHGRPRCSSDSPCGSGSPSYCCWVPWFTRTYRGGWPRCMPATGW